MKDMGYGLNGTAKTEEAWIDLVANTLNIYLKVSTKPHMLAAYNDTYDEVKLINNYTGNLTFLLENVGKQFKQIL